MTEKKEPVSPMFENKYRVSPFETLTWNKSGFVQQYDEETPCKNVQKIKLIFDTIPNLLQALDLTTGDFMVCKLLLRYGVKTTCEHLQQRQTIFSECGLHAVI